jgi:hypothetical protein
MDELTEQIQYSAPPITMEGKPKDPADKGKIHHIDYEGKRIYLFIGESGKHEVTIPDENRAENERERLHMDIVMRKISELNGYFEDAENNL